MEQVLIQEASKLHREVEQLENHCMLIDNEIGELEHFYKSIGEIENPEGKEILASIGKGVFSPAKMTSGEFFIEVGAGMVIKKTPLEIRKVIEEQIEKMKTSKTLFNQQLEIKFVSLQEVIGRIEDLRKGR